MQCILEAVDKGVQLYECAGVRTKGSAYDYTEHPNEFVLSFVSLPTTREQSSTYGPAAVEIAIQLQKWLAELSMELSDHKLLFARLPFDLFSDLDSSNLLKSTASCLGAVGARRAAPGERHVAYELTVRDFVAAAEEALGRALPDSHSLTEPTVAACLPKPACLPACLRAGPASQQPRRPACGGRARPSPYR